MGKIVNTSLSHLDGLAFTVSLGNHQFIIDTPDPKFGGQDRGPTPKSLLLPALGGCTGMDVASILQKMRVPFTGLRVEVEGEMNEEHPIHFTRMHVKYFVKGKDLPRHKVEQAVNMSKEKYCGVSRQLEGSAAITHEIVYEEDA